MAERIISQVEFEIGQTDQLLETYTSLLEQVRGGIPSLEEVTGMASVLHSFYNCLERIFLSMAKGIDWMSLLALNKIEVLPWDG